LSDVWITNGLTNVETKALVIPIKFCSFDDFWRIHSNTQGPPKPYIGGLSQEREQALKERLRADIFGNHPDGSITLHAKAWAVRRIVPTGYKILHRLLHAKSLADESHVLFVALADRGTFS